MIPSFKSWIALIALLSHGVRQGASCAIDPLAPVGWVWSGVKTTVGGVKSAVVGTANLGKGAYRFVNPTRSPMERLRDMVPTASEPPQSGYAPQGCFHDSQEKIDRGIYFEGGAGFSMNKEKCSSKCQLFFTKYFALRSNPKKKKELECWCSNNFGLLGKGTEYDCNNRCPGEEIESKELCGGDGFMSVYRMKL